MMGAENTKSPACNAGDFQNGDDFGSAGVSSTDYTYSTTATLWQIPVTTAQVDKPSTRLVVRDLRGEEYHRIHDDFILGGWARKIGPYGMAVYECLVFRGNRSGHAWLSYASIAELTGMSRRQVIIKIRELADLRIIHVERRKDEHGDPDTNMITLLDKSEWVPVELPNLHKSSKARGSESRALGGSESDSPGVVNHVHTNQSQEEPESPPTTQAEKDERANGGGGDLLPEEVAAVRVLIDAYVPDLNRINELLRRYPPATLGPAILATRRMKLSSPAGYLFVHASEVRVTDKDREAWRECVAAQAAGQTWKPKAKAQEAKTNGGMSLADWNKRNGRAS